jgi:ribokinase
MSAIVVGSINMDLVMPLDTFPKPGETVSTTELQKFPGGKGANQAVAIARLGKPVSLVGCVGDDEFGTSLLEGLHSNKVDTEGVRTIGGVSTGLAFITIDNTGQNMIVIVPGANGQVDRTAVDHAFNSTTEPITHFLTQFEIPLDTVLYSMREAKKRGWKTVLNPAPARPLHEVEPILDATDIIILNESETQSLTGRFPDTIDAAFEAGGAIHPMGPETIVLTLGEAGSVLITDQQRTHFPGCKVEVVDTTAAGDAFIGALVSAHMEGNSWSECIEFANAAGAYAATQPGAQPSLPTQDQIIQLQMTACGKST